LLTNIDGVVKQGGPRPTAAMVTRAGWVDRQNSNNESVASIAVAINIMA
jgi:hypothetical protein